MQPFIFTLALLLLLLIKTGKLESMKMIGRLEGMKMIWKLVKRYKNEFKLKWLTFLSAEPSKEKVLPVILWWWCLVLFD